MKSLKHTLKSVILPDDILNDKSAAGGIGTVALGIGTTAITIVIVALIISKLEPLIEGSSTASNSTIQAVFSTTWSALGLIPIAILVMGAAAIVMATRWLGNSD